MDDPYLSGLYAPTTRELDADLELIEGEIPRDLFGTYVRNGPNPKREAPGLHHWFDGDAMLHAVSFEDGRARYRNRYVVTDAMREEDAADRALWRGLMEPFHENPKGRPYKDTGNTDVLAFGGELLTLWYVSGAAHRVDPATLETLGAHRFGTEAPLRMSAHAKVDPESGELLFFDYGPRPPYLRYGVVGPDGALAHLTEVDVPGPRLPHDMAFTERYAVLMDLPVWPRAEAAKKKKWMVGFHPDTPARFGVLPRRGALGQHAEGTDVRWFEAEPCYVYHVVNAWEEDGAIVMIGCRCPDPIPRPDPSDGPYAQAFATLRLRATLHRWRFDLETGETQETPLDDRNVEFPSVDARRGGRRSRYGYAMTIPDTRTLLFDGVARYDHERDTCQTHRFGDGRYGSEAPFAPRAGADAEEDGYLVSLVSEVGEERSELLVYRADAVSDGPIARAAVPARVPLGFHATWVDGEVSS